MVVGGGVAGCAVAFTLAREGLSVRLVERDELAGHASGAAAGMLAPVGEAGEPGSLRTLGLESLRLFPGLCDEVRMLSGIDAEYEASGLLRVAVDEAAADRLRKCLHESGAGALGLEWLDADEAQRAEPGLAHALAGALWSPSEAHVRSPLLARGLAAAAHALGAEVEVGTHVLGLTWQADRVTGVRTSRGERRAGHVVVCTGCWAGELAEWLPHDVAAFRPPIEPVRGQILSLDSPPRRLRSIVWGDDTYIVPKRDGSVVVGATEERVGFDCRVTASGMAELLAAAPRLVPELANVRFREGWAGLRPGSPDGLPGVGPVPATRGLSVAIGHARNGVLLSPLTGRIVADAILGKERSQAAEVLDPARWC